MNHSAKATYLVVLIISFSLIGTGLFVATGVAALGDDDSDVAVT